MANANVQTKTVVTATVNLELSYTQAVALLLLTHCGTIGFGQFRNATDDVADALINAGITTENLSDFIHGCADFSSGHSLEGLLETSEQQFLARVTGDLRNIRDVRIDAELRRGGAGKIPAIKLLRELSYRIVDGERVCAGLKESKDEIDRRVAEDDYEKNPW